VIDPDVIGVTGVLPLVACAPVQSDSVGVAEAAHEVALVLDQVSVIACPTVAVLLEAVKVTEGFVDGGGGGADVPPPQPFQTSMDTNAANKRPFEFAFMETP
jgi:hypothetical protein